MTTQHTPLSIGQIAVHPLRDQLYDELHSRPFQVVPSPARITHLALKVTEQEKQAQFLHLQQLHTQLGETAPAQDAQCLEYTFANQLRVRWEKHTEFSSYTFTDLSGESQTPFVSSPLALLPSDWTASLPGTVVAAFHIAIEDARDRVEPAPVEVKPYFEQMRLVGSSPQHGDARIWTTFKLHSDGFGRFLIYKKAMSDSQLGRLVQRIVEIETYRLMTLLALPEARRLTPLLNDMDDQLAGLTLELAEHGGRGQQEARDLLAQLTNMAAQIEAYRAQTTFRFNAGSAYANLVKSRREALREDEGSGHLTIAEFLDRRLLPAVRTCEDVNRRLENLSRRIDRAADMMRTQVELGIQQQNRTLLESMDRRSKIQLRMQHTVEGLSVAAISYYLVGLIKYLLEALYQGGLPFDKTVATGIAVPVVLLLVWWSTQRIHHRFHKMEHNRQPDSNERGSTHDH